MYVKKLGTLLTALATIGFAQARPYVVDRDAVTDVSQYSSEIWRTFPISANTELEPKYFKELGSRRVKIRYGPLVVPPYSVNGGMKNWTIEATTKPCDDCMVYELAAGLEYPDGTEANHDTGMMVHHVFLYNYERNETNCATNYERLFASGNERLPVNLAGGNGSQKSGYWYSESNIGFMTELMNTHEEARAAFVTVEYEFLQQNTDGFARMTPLHLDATGLCGNVSVDPPADFEPFTLSLDAPFAMPFPAVMGGAGGHLHDGGLDLQLLRNDELVCTIVPRYGRTPGSIGEDGVAHLSDMDVCIGLGETVVGDLWSIRTHYDFRAHQPMYEGTKLAPVMGVAIIYLIPLPPVD